jgi:uncharacterized repeat protein (TIGR03803 family)
METGRKKQLMLCALTAGLGLLPVSQLTAQIFTTLHSYTPTSGIFSNNTNSDGAVPQAGLIASGSMLYGTAYSGGSSGYGTVFAITNSGLFFSTLHSFTNGGGGANPVGSLILSGNTLYGTANAGGSSGVGMVFAVSVGGTLFTNLHSFSALNNFTNSDGANPQAGLLSSGGLLYGTASGGGTWGNGTVFAVTTNGMIFTNLHNFTPAPSPGFTNNDGASPRGDLWLSGNTLYGTTYGGGSSGNGTVFAVSTDGQMFTVLHSFTATSGSHSTNSDGAHPAAGLVLSGNALFGTAYQGGASGNGTIFAINTDNLEFTNLHDFTANSSGFNSDGANPAAALILSGNTLYGTAFNGGQHGWGTVFAVTTNGGSFKTLYSFTSVSGTASTNSDGARPQARLILLGNSLYGTATVGGSAGNGTVFALSWPELAIVPAGTNVILMWPTNATGYNLQSATNLVSPVIWNAVSPGPVMVSGQFTVTNPISAMQQFYRLIH